MTTREYLSQYWRIDDVIKHKLSESDKWRDIAMSVGGTGLNENKVQTSKKYDRMGDAITKSVMYEQECENIASELVHLKKTIERQIDGMVDKQSSLILADYYIHDNGITEISKKICYSYNQTKRLLDKAHKIFEEIYRKEYYYVKK